MHTGDKCLYWGALVKWKIMLLRKTFFHIRWGGEALWVGVCDYVIAGESSFWKANFWHPWVNW